MTAEWRETVRTITDPTRPAPVVETFDQKLERLTAGARSNAYLSAAAHCLERANGLRSYQSSERYNLRKVASDFEAMAAKETEGQS